MLTTCYDPYSGTLGRFTRAEIFSLVAEAGYEGINIPVNSAFLGEFSSAEIEDAVKLAEKYNLVAPTIGFGNHILTTLHEKMKRCSILRLFWVCKVFGMNMI